MSELNGVELHMQAFIMMPYNPTFDRVFDMAIRPAVNDVGLAISVVKDEQYVGAVFERIQELIKQAKVCLADVTGGNPNVMWEAAYGQALGKPLVFIAQGPAEAIPFDVRHNRCILYDLSPEGLEKLRRDIAETIRAVLEGRGSDLQLMRQILLPKSIAAAASKFVVATNPLSYRAAYRVSEGWKKRPAATFSDYVGIRGLMRAFGLILGMQGLPELVNPDDFDDAALERAMHLYSIGSSKANRWTALVMERFFDSRQTRWDFRPDPESRDIRNPKVILRVDGDKYAPVGWKETSRVRNDFGIVLRGPSSRDSSLMVMVLAGRSSLGTEAASLAVTDPACIRRLTGDITHNGIDLENHRQAFLAVVSVECKSKDEEFQTDLDTFQVWQVFKC